MDYVAWDPSMSVGVVALDDDHRRLLDMFNSLLTSGLSRGRREDLSMLLRDLSDYTERHFAREEEAMDRVDFPEAERHKAAHRYFVDEVVKLKDEFEAGGDVMLRIDLILLLKEWFMEHIQTVDMQYRPFMLGAAERR